jgi:hypothetical protein
MLPAKGAYELKDKIERFSNGDFEYEHPYICLSEEEIRITVETGKSYEGSFTISNSMEREMKGFIYSSNRLMQIASPSFTGISNTVIFSFHADHLKAGEVIQGEISVVSDCGEKILPYTINIEVAHVATSLGKIKDLFQFANLARMDWSEAKKVFRMEEFEQIFLANEERYRYIYRNLIKSIATSQALEEFLIAIHKKAMIRLVVDKTQVEYSVSEEGISDKLILTKDHWGYAEIRVSTEAPFIQLEQKFLWADRFIGGTHQISYSIDPGRLRPGTNYGQIQIKTAYQTITVDVKCSYRKPSEHRSEYRLIQKLELGLIDNYLSFRLDKIKLDNYIEEAEALCKELPDREDSKRKSLIKAHLAYISGKEELVKEELLQFQREEALWKRRSVVEYCAYLYLNALFMKEEEIIKEAARVIRSYYENGKADWRILWFLLNIDSTYGKSGGRKLSDIREQYDAGCHSPILYYEAICILNQEPVLLRELSEFEIQILNFGIKNWMLTKELAQQYTYLAGKRKTYHPVIYQGLVKLYDEFGDADILSAICCLLIKGLKRSEKYFEWYRLGVEAQLRITELYEYYMYSISYSVKESLAQPVLLYFIYNSSISDRKKAFLYANIVRNKDKNEPIYRSYQKRMEIFAAKMLAAHQISSDLAILYREFMTKSVLTAELSRHMPYVIYRHELICENPNIISVRVVHKELGVEENQTLSMGRTQIDIFTSNAEIFLIDSFGNYFIESVDYNVTPFLNPEEYEKHCLEYSSHYMLLLHLFDRYQNYRIMSEDSIALRKQVLQIEGIAKEYVTDCYQTLIEYYYENYNVEQLEYYLNQIDLHCIKPVERAKYIEYMVVRKLYDLAFKALEIFGFEGITVNRLVKMCSGWMLTSDAEERQEIVVSLCYYVFSHGKYDEAILQYLVRYYEGATAEMLGLWKAAKSFELDTHNLEERLLHHLLFAESYLEDSYQVFCEYYKEITNYMLIRAYLTFYAYQYLVHEHIIPSELFPVMRRELNYDENDICLLAWLKYNIRNKTLTENERSFIERQITALVKKEIILPFFIEYRNQINLPEKVLNKCYITYITDPRSQVYIHFRLLRQQEQDYITERMTNVFMGIHVKEFVLFYHETVQYYVTEGYEEEEAITESFHAQYDPETPEDEDSRYNQINLMLMAVEVKDDSTLQGIMEHYIQREYLADTCFRQID